MTLDYKVIDIMNYPNFSKEGAELFYSGPESSNLRKRMPGGQPPTFTTEEYIAQMDDAGVEKVFLCALKMGSYRTRAMNIDYTPEFVYEEVKKYPGRFVGICGYDPYEIRKSIKDIEKAVKEYGFKGVYAHTLGWGIAANDRRMYPVYAKCVELDIPFSMQIGQSFEPLPYGCGRPIHVDEVALDFPDLKFVMSHTGYPWCEETVSIAWMRPNVYIDISAHAASSIPGRMPALHSFIDSGLGRSKVLFGTNSWPLKSTVDDFVAMPMSEKYNAPNKKAILRDNAIKLYKL